MATVASTGAPTARSQSDRVKARPASATSTTPLGRTDNDTVRRNAR